MIVQTMSPHHRWALRGLFFTVMAAACFVASQCVRADDKDADVQAVEFFEASVRPLLFDKCISCHGPRKQESGLRMDSLKAMLAGGDSGPAVIPFKPDESLIVEAVRRESFEMPPDETLTQDQVRILTQWVNNGAIWPATDEDVPEEVAIDFSKHWAFTPIRSPDVPTVKQLSWPQNDIDRFILRTLEENGIVPSPPASADVLMRRMKWDLLGLPVTFDETVSAVSTGASAEAVSQWIDGLLNSSHYGERSARYWLDIARYADTKGYVFFEKPEFRGAFTYRDYVIDSFNSDKPFNEFVREQLAADLLVPGVPHETQAALGFITIGPHFKNDIHDIIADRIDVVSRGLLGITIGCARCHDHKYDPISIDDYYSLYGVLHNSIEPLHLPYRDQAKIGNSHKEEAEKITAAAEKLQKHYHDKYQKVLTEGRNRLEEYLNAAQAQRTGVDTSAFDLIKDGDDLNPELQYFWKQYLEDADKAVDPLFVPWNRLAELPEERFPTEAAELIRTLADETAQNESNELVIQRLAANPPQTFQDVVRVYVALLNEISPPDATNSADVDSLDDDRLAIWRVVNAEDSPLRVPYHGFRLMRLFPDRESQKAVNELNGKLDGVRASAPVELAQMLVLEDADTIIEPRVFRRGNASRPTKTVPRQFPKFFTSVSTKPFEHGSGRLELADAVVSPENPLTARVIVNRIWRQHFGTGLVLTPGNFGVQAPPPSHPELLDHLASWFMDHNWSIKALHRYIMQSATYQQQSQARPELQAADPENRMCYRMNRRRMDFESMRDALLSVSGTLDLTVGGPSVKGIFNESNDRRTLYTHVNRQDVPGIMRTFDFPPPDVSSSTRDETTVPGQSLFLMNHPLLLSAAETLSAEAAKTATAKEAIELLFRRILHRRPSAAELTETQAFIQSNAPLQTADSLASAAWSYGYAALNEDQRTLSTYEDLPFSTGSQFQGGPAVPDPKTGWVFLNSGGGHPGNDLQHAAVIRWTAPESMTVTISGTFNHSKAPGDGVRGHVFHGDNLIAGPWLIHQKSVDTTVAALNVQEGETLSFVVDIYRELNHDSFQWSPTITKTNVEPNNGEVSQEPSQHWNYTENFQSPVVTPLQNVAQVLLMSNEFHFVD